MRLPPPRRRIERHRQHDVRQAQRPAQEDRPDALARRQRRAQRRHQAHALDVGRAHRFVVAERVVARRVLQVRGLCRPACRVRRTSRRRRSRRSGDRRAAGTSAAPAATAPRPAPNASGRRCARRRAGSKAGCRCSWTRSRRPAWRPSARFLRQRAAQRVLPDAQRRIARDGDREAPRRASASRVSLVSSFMDHFRRRTPPTNARCRRAGRNATTFDGRRAGGAGRSLRCGSCS